MQFNTNKIGQGIQRLRAVFFVISLITLLPAVASELGVDPVSIELSAKQKTAALKVTNASNQPSSIQIQAVTWSQIDGKDVYIPSKDLLVAPPIITIAPHGEQIVRVALRRKADATNELPYRIFLNELPVAPPPGFRGLQVALRIGLPVFVKPLQGIAAPKMLWNISKSAENTLLVSVKNQGNAHVQVTDFSIHIPGSVKALAGESGSTYILPGQTSKWQLKSNLNLKDTDTRLQLKAYTDAGNVDEVLSTEHP